MTLPRGKVTAVVGHSGAGKSTIAALISRFYTPTSGDVLLAGQSAQSFSRGEWAKAVALVSQEPVLFSGLFSMLLRFFCLHACSLACSDAGRSYSECPFASRKLSGIKNLLLCIM